MSLMRNPGVLGAVERQVALLCPDDLPVLPVRLDSGQELLSLRQARASVYGADRAPERAAALWRMAAAAAQQPADHGPDGLPTLLGPWLALPSLARRARLVLLFRRASREEMEAEGLLAFLEAQATLDPELPDLGRRLLSAGVGGMWRYTEQGARETPVADIGTARAPRLPHLRPERWELTVDPPSRPTGLAATIRFTASATELEGHRLGSLTHRLGLREVVFRARHLSPGPQIGTLSLRPSGVRR